jgi:hypothetical protein
MISMGPQLKLESLGDALNTALNGDGAVGEGFLESLLAALPPELQGLTPEQLAQMLQNQDPALMPVAAMPVPLELAAQAQLEPEPTDFLGLLLSSRSGLMPSGAQSGEGAIWLAEAGLLAQAAQPEAAATPQAQPFQSLLQSVGSLTTRPPATAEPANFTLSTPVQDPEFGQAVGERLVWMVSQGVQQAKIHLDPAHLGPLEISLAVKDDVASVVINAHHATTREVLEGDTQRLRNMLSEGGFTQVDVNVARDGGQQPGGQNGRAGAAGLFGADPEPEAGAESEGGVSLQGRGLVDHYA